MAFHDVRLPDDIERGALGGPAFNTTLLQLESGAKRSNINWSQVLGGWDIGYGLLLKFQAGAPLDLDTIQNFFYVRQGRAHTFRFKDWSEFQLGDPNDPTTDNQDIGVGDTAQTVFQVVKTYSSGGFTYDRDIFKLVSGTVTVLLDNVIQVSGFTVDLNRGTVTFSVAPGAGVVVAVVAEFDVHVRLATDKLNLSMELFNVGSWPNIPIEVERGHGL